MMPPLISLLLDGLIVTLLMAFIAFAVRLNRSLSGFRDGKAELERLIRDFGDATTRAESGIKVLKKAAEETGEALQQRIDKAKALRDELNIMVETGEALADRLAAGAHTRHVPASAPRAEPRPEPRPVTARPELRVAADSPLAAQMRAAEVARSVQRPTEQRPGAVARPAAEPAPAAGAPRSKAERELLQAIESLR